MGKRRRDNRTLDLFDSPANPAKIEPFNPIVTRAASTGAAISKALSQTLKDAETRNHKKLSRAQIAQAMGDYLGVEVPLSTLNAYASQAREHHDISLVRVMATMAVTEDYRLLVWMAEQLGLRVIPAEFEGAVREAMLAERVEEMKAELEALRRRRKP